MAAAGVLLHLLVDPLGDVRRQDLHERGGGQPPHRVVLDGAARQVSVGHEGEVVDSPDTQNNTSSAVPDIKKLLNTVYCIYLHAIKP